MGVIPSNYNDLETQIKQCVEDCKVLRRKILNPPREDWINSDIITGICPRNYLWTQHKNNTEDETLKKDFEMERDKLAKLIQNTKKSYYYKLFTNCTNPKKMWSLINSLTSNKLKQCSAPSKLEIDSKSVTDLDEICEIFNTYFSSIGSKLANNIPKNFMIVPEVLLLEHK